MAKKVAIVSDQLAGGIGGAESIVFAAHELYPSAPVFVSVLNEKIIPQKYQDIDFRPSFIQKLPFAAEKYKMYLPIMPLAMEFLNLQEYDVIFSSHHSVAKGVIPRPDSVHICYCHSPARYLWDQFWTYSKLNNFNMLQQLSVSMVSQYLRIWDVTCANRVNLFLANSNYTAKRIKKFWGRDSQILFPPVDTNKFNNENTDDYYLMVGRLVAYKGFELAVDAFNESGKKLIIIGDGAEFKKLKAKAKSNITLTGKVSEEELVKYFNNCKGFIFPGKEDFGIVMAEAQAAGKPVIAFNAGGACDIVINNETGLLFDAQTVERLNDAIKKSERINWCYNSIKESSKRFDKSVFETKLKYVLDHSEEYE